MSFDDENNNNNHIASEIIPTLPISLVASILTYNVTNTKDLAELRLVGKTLSRQAKELLVSQERFHRIQCPERRLGKNYDGSFVERLCALDLESYDEFCVMMGDIFVLPGNEVRLLPSDVLPSPVEVRVVGSPKSLNDVAKHQMGTATSSTSALLSNESSFLGRLQEVCESLIRASKLEHLITDQSDDMVFFKSSVMILQPSNIDSVAAVGEDAAASQEEADTEYDNGFCAVPALVTFGIDPSASYIYETAHVNNHTFYRINIMAGTTNTAITIPCFQPLYSEGHQVWAVDAGPDESGSAVRLVRMLLYLKTHIDQISNADEDMQPYQTLSLRAHWEEHQQHQWVEGVVIVDDFIQAEVRQSLNAQVDALAQKQEREDAVDYHPHSNQVVRDLVHPALYSYIRNLTPLVGDVGDVEPCRFPNVKEDAERQQKAMDFWGRAYETSPYQWLPSYVRIADNGVCTFETYINNLTPRNDPVHSVLYKSLEDLLRHALPYMESVLSYVYAVQPLLRFQQDDDGLNYDRDPLKPMNIQFINLRGHQLQVITKIVDYELSAQHDTYEGVWHVEGMSHEEIVLTCLYILDRDDAIEGGEIEFKRAFFKDEAEFIFSSVPQMRPFHFNALVEEGLAPLGTVATPIGRLVVFPNSHVHRVKAMKLVGLKHHQQQQQQDDKRIAKRRIVVFFVVNPQKRIISTREVAPQQAHSGGKLPHEQALIHRLALMAERKYKKQDWNVRPIELCEH